MAGEIYGVTTAELPALVAGLIREGVTFRVRPASSGLGDWVIELTGGC